MKSFTKSLLAHGLLLIVYFLVWAVLFRAISTKQDMTVIAGSWATILATVVVSTTFLIAKRLRKNSKNLSLNLLSIILICFFAGTSFLFTVPAINDRSLSIYLTSSISVGNRGISENNLKDFINLDWNQNNVQLKKRIQEQVELGNIKVINNEYYCPTTRLKMYLLVNKKISKLLGINMRYLEGSDSILTTKNNQANAC